MLLELLKVIFFLSGLITAKSDRSDLIIFIMDFLEKQHMPTNINSFLCWENNDLIKLSGEFWKNNYMLRLTGDTETSIETTKIKEHQVFLVDLNCNFTNDILRKADEKNLFKQPYRWIVVGDISEIISTNLNIGVDSMFFVIHEENGLFHVRAPYKYSKNTIGFDQNKITVWKRKDGFQFYNHLNIGRNRTNLNRLTLKISYVITNPNSLKHLWDYREKHVDTISKLNYLLMHHLMDFTNATKEFLMQISWGYKQKNSSYYDGMVGDLQRGIADLGGTASFFTFDRIAVVDYIAVTYKTYFRFIFRAPPLSYVSNIFAMPFDIYVWYSCFGILLLTCVAIYLVVVWEWNDPSFKDNFTQDCNGCLRPSITDVIMLEISAISQQGSSVEPKSLAGRIATIFIFISVIFLYTSYSASIVVLLQSTTDSIKTLEDLLNFRIKLGVEDIVYAHYYFENEKEPIRKAIYERKIAPKDQKSSFMTVEEGIKRVQNEFFAFHVELSTGYKIIGDIFEESEKCGLQEVTYLKVIEPWLPIQKDSNYKEIMKVGMRRIHEHGLQHREASRTYTRKPGCHISHVNFGSVGLIDCYFAFIVFGVGVLLSLMILISEILFMKHTVKKYGKKDMF